MSHLLVAFFVFSGIGNAAFNSTSVWNVRSTATAGDVNGGAFDPGVASPGTNFSLQDARQIAYTDIVIGATTTQGTSVANPFGATSPGNFVNIISGAGCTVQRVEVLSVAGMTATFDKSLGTAASVCTGNFGGALRTIGAPLALAVAGNLVYVMAGTYSTAANLSPTNAGSSTLPSSLLGYTATQGDGGRATITASANGVHLIDIGVTNWNVANFNLTCTGFTGTHGAVGNSNFLTFSNLVVTNCSFSGVDVNQNAVTLVNISVTGAVVGGFIFTGNASLSYLSAINNTGPGFVFNTGSVGGNNLISANNSGATSDCYQDTGTALLKLSAVVAYNCGRDGMRFVGAGTGGNTSISDGIFVNNVGYGINSDTTNYLFLLVNYNGFFGNGTAARNNVPTGANDVTLTVDPFVNGAGNNFALTNTAGGGAAVRAAGFPGVMLTGGTGFVDIGAIQHQDAGGGQFAVAH